jgi:predicted extracellular nuclease
MKQVLRVLSGLSFVVLAVVVLAGVFPASATTAVFINEIHYDNTGTDTGEAIEIAGPAGTDLTGWTVVLYNGSGGAVYDTVVLTGVLPDQQAGYGTLSFARTGIQNGAPDGLALVDATSTVVQFLSYEGAFTAVGGPADGMTSTNIGVLESGSGAIGNSLQLDGTGTTYEDFTWSAEAPNTFGAVNTGQTFSSGGPTPTPTPVPTEPPAAPQIVINEIMQNPAAVGDSAGEWFELFNPTSAGVDINGWTIGDNDTDSHLINNGGPLLVPAGGYLVLGNNGDSGTNGGVSLDYVYGSSWFLANGADEVVLLDGTLTEIDRVEYDGGPVFPDPNGASMSLADPTLDNNIGANWCESTTSIGDGDLGTPGSANECGAPPTIELVINEIMQNPAAVGDSSGEWFELFNPTEAPIDIDGWTIGDDDTDSHLLNNGGPLIVPAGGFIVLGNNTDSATNGGAAVDYSYGLSWFLANGADEVVLYDADMTEIDRVEYDGGPLFPDPNGASMSLADPTLDNNVGENWCGSITPFGDGDLGTPGAANECAPPPPPEIELVINEIMQNPAAVGDSAGEWFELYNPTGNPIDIDGWTIADNGSDSHLINNGGPLVVPAAGYLVLGNNSDSGTNGGLLVDYSYGSSMFLANGDDEVILLDGSLSLIDRVDYDGGPVFPDPNGASMSLADPTLDNNDGANWCESATPFGDGDRGTPGSVNECPPPPPAEACGDPFTPIYTIQGSGLASPLNGTEVSTEGIVVGDFQAGLGGFNLQDANGDADPTTSDGIFVFAPSPDVMPGDLVRVRGFVDEFFNLTEITGVSQVWNCSSGNSIAPTAISLPVTSLEDFEPYEGMLINFPQTLYISEYFNFDRFGEIVLTPGRLYQPTAAFAPGSPGAQALADENARSRITLDDGRTSQNPDPARHPNGFDFDLGNRFRGGDQLQDVTGVMDYAFDLYRIQPTQGATYIPANPRPANPDAVGGEIRVASFNVLNYFTTIDNAGPICGPGSNQDCRGADNAEEFTRQRDKIISALAALDADIVGVIEIENHPTDAAMADLVAGLNDAVGAGTYAYIATGPIGTDAIKVGLLYKPSRVTPSGAYAILDSSVDPDFLDDKNRPVLAQTFESNSDGALLTVAVNHLKSKGSACDDVGDPIDPLGQGNCNGVRTAAAEALAAWLATDPTGSGDPDVLIIGDLNSYDHEDPITALLAAGYTDLVRIYQGEDAYTYVFDAQLGYLDYALANLSLLPQVTGLSTWHINADEPDLIDYDTSFKRPAQDALYEPNAYRSSDHDPVLVGLDLNVPPVCGAAFPSVDSLWPVNHKFVAVEILGITDPDGDPITVTIESIFQDEPVNGTGDGNTSQDGELDAYGAWMHVALLRAERDGGGNGRVYHVTFRATDPLGFSCTGSVQVSVPLNQGKKGSAVDDGPLYDSMLVP